VPWCDTCDRFFTPTSMNEDGSCPECGKPIAAHEEALRQRSGSPWHFKLLVAVMVVYLGYRLVQLVLWLV
jgi:predicted RNA-binding Zn-ribbon protein involved in translation (DUF1610 family)